ATGKDELIGSQGIAIAPLPAGAEGMVRVHGELWRAESSRPVQEGAAVLVLRVEGVKLYVEPADVAVSGSKLGFSRSGGRHGNWFCRNSVDRRPRAHLVLEFDLHHQGMGTRRGASARPLDTRGKGRRHEAGFLAD